MMSVFSALLNVIGIGMMVWWIYDTNKRMTILEEKIDEVEEDIEEIYSNDYPPVLPDNKT